MSKIMDPRSLLHGIGILAVAGLVDCGLGGRAHGPASPDASAAVDMGFSSFQPEAVHIRAGQMVEWRNTSIITHSVTNDSRAAPKPQDASIPAGATAFSSGDIPAAKSSPPPSPCLAPTNTSARAMRAREWWEPWWSSPRHSVRPRWPMLPCSAYTANPILRALFLRPRTQSMKRTIKKVVLAYFEILYASGRGSLAH